MKSFVRPKSQPEQPDRPLVHGYPTYLGMPVIHAKYGAGSLQWCEWRLRSDGSWVQPLERDRRTGHWLAIVSQPHGSYMAPLDELQLGSS